MIKVDAGVELLSMLKKKDIIIYGTGFQAREFFGILQKHCLEKRVINFVTTNDEGERFLFDIPIVIVENLQKGENCIICIAAHEIWKSEIENILSAKGMEDYVWVAPYRYEMMFGTPIQKGVHIPLRTIWDANKKDDYRIAVRYLTIENYYGKNNRGYELYRRCMLSISKSLETAEKRLQQYIQVIKNWEKKGYEENSHIQLWENYECIDGFHRTTIGIYFKEKTIGCDIYSLDNREFLYKAGRKWTEQDALKSGYDLKDIEMLKDAKRRINEQFELI